MSLPSGSRMGPYEIVAPLGAGGMGEVYRAKDTTLDRLVAIKVMPESFALDADRVARFTREAKTLAALNHPNIAAIFGFEKTPDLTALVMEQVEGEDLSVIIARGPIPLLDALPIARQIAEALEAARKPKHHFSNLSSHRWAAGTVRGGPPSRHQAPMPSQQCRRRDDEGPPAVTR